MSACASNNSQDAYTVQIKTSFLTEENFKLRCLKMVFNICMHVCENKTSFHMGMLITDYEICEKQYQFQCYIKALLQPDLQNPPHPSVWNLCDCLAVSNTKRAFKAFITL